MFKPTVLGEFINPGAQIPAKPMRDYASRATTLWKENGPIAVIRGLYRVGYYDIYRKILYKIASEKKAHTIEDITVQAPTETYWQYNHFSELIERKMIGDFISEIRTDDTVFDVGAFLGWHTLFAAKAAEDGLTVAFEPHPVSFSRLEEVLRCAEGTVQSYNYALSDAEASVTIPRNSSSGAEISEDTSTIEGFETKAVRGDELIQSENLPVPNVIKIDVEGKEKEVLDGLKRTISSDECRVIYCEMHPQKSLFGNALYSKVVDCLENVGFEWSVLDGTERVIIKAKDPTN